MSIANTIKERRSVHAFEATPVPLELVTTLLDTAVWAPNHRLTQPWRFVVVHGDGRRKLADVVRDVNEKRERDPDKRKETGQKFYDKFMSVPMFVAVVMKEDPNPVDREEDYAATCCVVHNFGLLAWEHGIGMVWETYGLIHQPSFRQAYGVEPGEKIVASLHVGYPAKVPAAQPRIPAEQRLTVIE
ncbi:nitroreductase [Paenibacillus sp. TRM 82003]|nr:nitroreductase [Paenibacillus sp. TRM 82003]